MARKEQLQCWTGRNLHPGEEFLPKIPSKAALSSGEPFPVTCPSIPRVTEVSLGWRRALNPWILQPHHCWLPLALHHFVIFADVGDISDGLIGTADRSWLSLESFRLAKEELID